MSFIDKILDASVYFSFDRSGFLRHKKKFKKERFDGKEKTALVTGANSGLGFATTEALCQYGVAVHMVCRDASRGQKAIEKIKKRFPNAQLTLHCIDISITKGVQAYFSGHDLPHFDIVVNNAGSMPETLTFTNEGEELTWATHMLGHYVLIESLIERRQLQKGARVITVASGGMYTQRLTLDDLCYEQSDYNKYTAYANAKRAQVIQNRLWNEKYGDDFVFSCMHPGWAETPGVINAMPTFYRWMKSRLRSPEEGADTIIWLALTETPYPGGQFWFDRSIAPEHKHKKTKETPEQQKKLKEILEKYTQR